ncbi:MAG TPA: ImmA/IrrE family metallo-endopeptidase [Candidatus Competibacter sp.]|nr:ImmA/IrrE family metallo-endopeptidase [Candidatus Competibacter sp.]
MAFRRGFKSQCERRSVEFRKQVGASAIAPLLAGDLARALGVTVWSTDQVSGVTREHLDVLNDQADDSWAALTMRVGSSNLVIYKPVQSVGRRNNAVMHELAHIILGHELARACLLDDGSLVPGNFNQEQEDEADWLAGTLLLPRPALLSIRERHLIDSEACQTYEVSQDMLAWRIRMTGIDYQLARSCRANEAIQSGVV